MKTQLRLAGVLLCAASPLSLSPVFAQEAAATAEAPAAAPAPDATAAPAPAAGPAASDTHLLAGAEVRMVTRSELSSRTNHLGDRFELEVTDDVGVNGQVMIPRGSIATGEITRVRKKGGWGRSGILETRLVSVLVGDHQYRMRGAAGDRGRAGTAAVVGAVLLSPLIIAPFMGFFVTGTSAVVPAQTVTVAYTDEDVPLAYAVAPSASPAAASAEPAPAATPQSE